MSRLFRRFLIFLSIMGPGIITANVDNDAGGITTYSIAGAHFGYVFLWSLIPIMIALTVIQVMVARLGVVTGKGLSDLIRERFGVKVTFYVLLILFFCNLGNIVAEFAGVSASLGLIESYFGWGIGRFWLVMLSGIFVWFIVVKGTYRIVEKIFLIASLFYVFYIITGFIVKPDWVSVRESFLQPRIEINTASMAMLLGLIGTTIAPWMQFYQQSSIVEKNIKPENYRFLKADVIFGCIALTIVASFIILVCAATLFPKGIQIDTAEQAALALEPLVGSASYLLFAFGLLNASLFAASILPLSTAYVICEGMGWEEGVNKKFAEAPQFYGLYTLLIFTGVVVILIPGLPLIKIMYFSQVLNGILLPLILIFMLLIINNKKIMGDQVNTKTANIFMIVLIGIIILSTVMLFS